MELQGERRRPRFVKVGVATPALGGRERSGWSSQAAGGRHTRCTDRMPATSSPRPVFVRHPFLPVLPQLAVPLDGTEHFAETVHIKGRTSSRLPLKLIEKAWSNPRLQDHPAAQINATQPQPKQQLMAPMLLRIRCITAARVF
eukprot:scaffold18_cov111-Isochrysis_galbana.AAC.8